MCDSHNDEHDHDHEHTHGHEHGHSQGDHCCTPSEDYERNITEQRNRGLTRRQMLHSLGAAGLLIAGSSISAGNIFASNSSAFDIATSAQSYIPQSDNEFDGYYYISGDHHIHTHFSPDGKYSVQRQVAEANYHGLGWMVITDHGSATHNKIGVDLTYPEIVNARKNFDNMIVFTGLEMNIPGGEHGTVIIQPHPAEKDQIKAFEAAYDGAIGPNTEEQAVAGLKYLDKLDPKPLFFANHPARRGLDSPHEIRNWKSAAPEVAYGFEGAPGHQAAGLIRDSSGKIIEYRGFYGNSPNANSWPGYPKESYFTYGGFDWMTAKLGGLWDSLLGDGIRWWITANSDAHKYFNDLQDVDSSKFNSVGFVSEVDNYFRQQVYGDFRPGEYSRTYVVAKEFSPISVMAALRGGRVFVVQGDLIDRLLFTASVRIGRGEVATATMGDTLTVKKGSDVQITIKIRIPEALNWNGQRPMVDHVDLISGKVNYPGKSNDLDNFANPTTKVVRTYSRGEWDDHGDNGHDDRENEWSGSHKSKGGQVLEMKYTFSNVKDDFYVRLRGTNTRDRGATPAMNPDQRGQTGPANSPWDDLWFYANPIFVKVS